MRIVHVRLAALAFAATGVGMIGVSAPAAAQVGGNSSAYGLSGILGAKGTATEIAQVAPVSGGGTKAYTHGASVPLFSESLGVVAGGSLIGSLAIVSSGVATHVSGTGTAGATVQTEADTSIASLQITLALNPPPGSTQPPAAPLLSVTATNLTSQVTDTRTLPSVAQQTGSANFGALSVSGSLVGSQTLSFQGAAPANTVLYSDPNMTITLNQQTVTGVIDCTPNCQFVPKRMTAEAVLVQMFKKPLEAKLMANGQVVLGKASAGMR
jgi:hypothetical protein